MNFAQMIELMEGDKNLKVSMAQGAHIPKIIDLVKREWTSNPSKFNHLRDAMERSGQEDVDQFLDKWLKSLITTDVAYVAVDQVDWGIERGINDTDEGDVLKGFMVYSLRKEALQMQIMVGEPDGQQALMQQVQDWTTKNDKRDGVVWDTFIDPDDVESMQELASQGWKIQVEDGRVIAYWTKDGQFPEDFKNYYRGEAGQRGKYKSGQAQGPMDYKDMAMGHLPWKDEPQEDEPQEDDADWWKK